MEGACLDHGVAHAEPVEGPLRAFLKLLGRILVEGEHDDPLGLNEPAIDGIGGLGDHGGGLAGASRGDNLHAVFEADDGAGLFFGQRLAFDPVQEVLGQHQFARCHGRIGLGPHSGPIQLPVVQGIQRGPVTVRMQIVVQVLIEEQPFQLGRRQGQGGAVGQQLLLLFVSNPAAAGAAAVSEGIGLGQPRLDLLQDVRKERLAPARGARKEHLLDSGRQPGCLAVGQAVHGQRLAFLALQRNPGPEQARKNPHALVIIDVLAVLSPFNQKLDMLAIQPQPPVRRTGHTLAPARGAPFHRHPDTALRTSLGVKRPYSPMIRGLGAVRRTSGYGSQRWRCTIAGPIAVRRSHPPRSARAPCPG